MLTSNRPAIVERHKDAKASLEAELKASCEGLIAHVSAQLTQPLLPFLVRYGTATATGGAEAEGSGVGEALPSAEACAKILQETERLPALHGALSLYLNNAITLAILFRPMKTAVSDALQQYSAVAQRAMQDAERDALDVPGQLGRSSLKRVGSLALLAVPPLVVVQALGAACLAR
ncbi:hypothetical protein T492DRAFT_912957 [Pavlovales sp. CCMP2436]|nr:hypothetical protein T492DRAFT_912957 [Pavlovales sp. CCMP2436]